MQSPKERVKIICTELGEDLDSPNCKRLNEFIKTCPNCEAFVDSVKKTIKLYQSISTNYSSDIQKRLYKKLNLE